MISTLLALRMIDSSLHFVKSKSDVSEIRLNKNAPWLRETKNHHSLDIGRTPHSDVSLCTPDILLSNQYRLPSQQQLYKEILYTYRPSSRRMLRRMMG